MGVLTQPDRPAGRGQRLRPSPVKELAQEAGIPVAQPPSLGTPEERAPLTHWQPDLLVVVAYGLILPAAVLELPPRGCVNVHASLLPAYRGAAPVQRAILDGCPETGISIMVMDAGLDSGPVLLERHRPIGPRETAGELHDALACLGAEALAEALVSLKAGTLQPVPQDDDRATYAPKIAKGEARLDWNRPAEELDRAVRAFNPWPVAHTLREGQPLRIWRARPVPGEPGTAPGTVRLRDGEVTVACGGNSGLVLEEIQPAGRKRMTGPDAVRGGYLGQEDSLGSSR